MVTAGVRSSLATRTARRVSKLCVLLHLHEESSRKASRPRQSGSSQAARQLVPPIRHRSPACANVGPWCPNSPT